MQFFVNGSPVCGDTVPLGVQGENLATQITADVSGWLAQWPDGQVIVRLIDANRQSHLANTVVNDGTLVWIVTAADTALGGYGVGVIELVQGDVVKKSEPFATRVITDPQASGQAPEPVPGWVEETISRMEELEASAAQSADAAQTSAGSAQTGAQSAQTAADQAAQSAEDAAAVLPQVETAGAAQVAAVQAEGQAQQTAIQQKGADTLASIPADYTELSGDVADLKSALQDTLDIEVVSSKNLNKTPYPDSYTANGVTFSKNDDGSLTLSGTPTRDIYWPAAEENGKWLLPAGTYTISPAKTRMAIVVRLFTNKSDTSQATSYSAGANATTFTTTSDYWAWVRIDILSAAETDGYTIYPQVEAGTQVTAYQDPYYAVYSSAVLEDIKDDISEIENAISEYDEDIASLNTRVDTVTNFEVGKNLVDPNARVVGAIQSNGSIATDGAWSIYGTSGYIALNADTNYAFSLFNPTGSGITPVSDQRLLLLLFDESKSPVANSYQNVDNAGTLTFNSGNAAKYVRVSGRKSYNFQLEIGTVATAFESFDGKNVIGLPLGFTPMAQSQCGNILYGKKWAVCGDSFTDGADTGVIANGKYQGRRIVYPYIIGNRNNMDIVKFFNGGRTLAFPAEPGSFVNSLTNPNSYAGYYQNIPSDVDYITIYLGINDANHAIGSSGDGEDTTGYIPLGTITDNTTASYYGAWNVVLTWLISNRPNAHIGIIVTNGNTDDAYRQAQIAIAEKYGIPYIDMNGDSRTPAMLRTSNPNIAAAVKTALIEKWRVSSSNTHPNDAAHLFESTFIEAFLRSI